ncbi:RusA family crossover junction endodeoxyribonuclease [Deinococcus peraridilitoris]|uniref:Endodeoxyribonuclease RusA n=1 Tax=Deinococcus peraridilitoris (strain DSM 19664 / LMG 22246 / CIP 109416 / KR-200) TaxID=937777 RepID=L0A0Y4_DEIPD|nr:RusA family crossover junction endodeoxyribonuclease [Deinococcus peraridilitoris]AFZ67099.1 Endodeoxyribonuclease RusA [Deinococcus peraridilitoris DSM 19664]
MTSAERRVSAAGETLTFTIPALPCWRRTKDKLTGKVRERRDLPQVLKLVGYYSKGKVPNWVRSKEYDAWKDHVRLFAPLRIKRLNPRDKSSRVQVDVFCYFPSANHSDPENIRKGIVDALFGRRQGKDDQWVFGYHHWPEYDGRQPRVEVHVTIHDAQGELEL